MPLVRKCQQLFHLKFYPFYKKALFLPPILTLNLKRNEKDILNGGNDAGDVSRSELLR